MATTQPTTVTPAIAALPFKQGSEWRKWDLHVHTPASVLNNGYGADWDAYVRTLFTTLIQKQIAVVGITDYFSIEGYKKIKEEYLADEAKLQKLFSAEEIDKLRGILVLPNIELRSDTFVGSSSINFHILLSDALPVKDIEEKFLHEIDFLYQGEPQAEDKKRKLRQVNLEELGAQLKRDHAQFTGSELFVGMTNAVVDHKQVTKILSDKSNIFGGKYLFVVMADEDLSKINWNSRDHLTRKVLIQKSDMLFSSSAKTREWALGRPPYMEGVDKFVAEFMSLKPCLHGSDAHEFKYLAHPCSKRGEHAHECTADGDCDLRFCWIKADPTFEGLKQVLYEPDERVTIQAANPTAMKSSQTITEFHIAGLQVDPELGFAETRLLFNPALVAVAGGRGSGKTALVDLIANIYEDRAFCDDKNSFVKRICEGDALHDLQTQIRLQNGLEYAKEIKTQTFADGASLVYVAQGELEKHVEDPAHLETYINKLIFESNGIKDSELLFDYHNISDDLASLNESLKQSNEAIFALESQTDSSIEEGLNKQCKKVATDLQDTEKKIEELAKSLSKEKIKAAEEKQNELARLRDKKTQLNELGVAIKGTLHFVDQDLVEFNERVTKINTLAEQVAIKDKFATIEYRDAEILRGLIVTLRVELRKVIGEIERFQKDLEEKEKGVKEHAKLLDKRKELEKSVLQLTQQLKVVAQQKTMLSKELAERESFYRTFLTKKIEQRDQYLKIISAFSTNKSDILNDLEFTAELSFDRERFVETVSELVDLRRIKIRGAIPSDSEIAFFVDAMSQLTSAPSAAGVQGLSATQMPKLISKIVPHQKKSETMSRQTAYDALFADYLTVVPSVKYKKVRLSKLSLGQKATVLLKIYLAQGDNPILVDSHDDHLDNEFIMEELVKALRQAKLHRQVIIVSNNGNVVVNSDAEQVIIASRSDKGEISYSAGSLENPSLRSRLLAVLEGGELAFSKRQQKYRLRA